MTIAEILKLANDDAAPPEFLATLAACEITGEGPDDLELLAPELLWAPESKDNRGLLAHAVGVLTKKRTTANGWRHNPWSVGLCCAPARDVIGDYQVGAAISPRR